MEPIIRAKDLNFVYNKGKDNEFHALVNISIDIYPEEFIIVFGPSGCGKSTLLNVFAGLEMPDTGSIIVFNRNLTTMSKKDFALYHRSQVGMIYQSYNLITSLSVLDNVTLPQLFVNVRKHKRNKWGMQLLERFGILKQAKKIPSELSGGQQQRIGIARAIVNNPKIILADEPVGNLDSNSAKNVLEILEELNEKEKKTIILVTHNPEYLEYGDRIIYMKDGVITQEVVNKEKHQHKDYQKPKSVTSKIDELMRAYSGLSPEQINILIMPYKSKVFANHFISLRNIEETKVFEDIIQRRLLGTITEDELYDILRQPTKEGGVGFDKRTASKIIRRLNRIIRMAYYIYQKAHQKTNESGEHKKISNEEKSKRLCTYLLKTCYTDYYKSLDEIQVSRMRQVIKDRLKGSIQKSDVNNYLDLPIKEGGVGLNSKTAKTISEELELILILGYGVVRMFDDSKKDKQTVKIDKETQEELKNHLSGINSAEFEKTVATDAQDDSSVGEILNKIYEQASAESDKEKASKNNNNTAEEQRVEDSKNQSQHKSAEPIDSEKNDSDDFDNGELLSDAMAKAQEKEELIKETK